MKVLEHVAHRFAKHVRVNGVLCLSPNGDPALVRVFSELGWSDPHPIEAVAEPVLVAATVEAPERAVMPSAKGRRG